MKKITSLGISMVEYKVKNNASYKIALYNPWKTLNLKQIPYRFKLGYKMFHRCK